MWPTVSWVGAVGAPILVYRRCSKTLNIVHLNRLMKCTCNHGLMEIHAGLWEVESVSVGTSVCWFSVFVSKMQ